MPNAVETLPRTQAALTRRSRRPAVPGGQADSRSRKAWHAFKRLTAFGWPRRFVIVQFPNVPLILAFVAGQIEKHAQASVHADAASVSYLAMGVWAYLELVDGVNWFRRLLGVAYLVSTGIHLALALHG